MKYHLETSGVCSIAIDFTLENGVVNDIAFEKGCDGNLQGIAALCGGRPADELIEKLAGIRCGSKETSCPDQLAKALEKAVQREKND